MNKIYDTEQEKIEIYLYNKIKPDINIIVKLYNCIKATNIDIKKLNKKEGIGNKIILWTNIVPLYIKPGRFIKKDSIGVYIDGWMGNLEQLIMTTESRKYAIRHVFVDGNVRDYEPCL